MEGMIGADRALKLVLQHVPQPRSELCSSERALGRYLAETIVATHDVPSFCRAKMDGFAVRVHDAGKEIHVRDVVGAGHTTARIVESGHGIQIMTGAPCPTGTEAIVMIEDIVRVEDRIRLPENIILHQHMEAVGELCQQGNILVQPPARITPWLIGVLAAFDRGAIHVFRLPRMALISTGDELATAGEALRPGQIRDSNGIMLRSLAQEQGVDDTTLLHASDSHKSLLSAMNSAEHADIVVLSGGVSMGLFDLVAEVLEHLGATIVFRKVQQTPGKPMLFAVAGEKLIFGLPGKPQSTHFCFSRYVAPALRAFAGDPLPVWEGVGILAADSPCEGNGTRFIPMQAQFHPQHFVALYPFDKAQIRGFFGSSQANAYVRVEPHVHRLRKGEPMPFLWVSRMPE